MRIGHGYDVHRLVKGRRLIIGTVEIDYELGLDGHSDADVLLHAISDALLGAAAMGDIGLHFPDSDEKYLGADSSLLLARVCEMIRERGYEIENLDCTVIAQRPKLRGYIEQMRSGVAKCCSTDVDAVSIKATTEEGLGFTGQGLGIAAHCVCLISRRG